MIGRSLAMPALHSWVKSQIWQLRGATWQTSLQRAEQDVKWLVSRVQANPLQLRLRQAQTQSTQFHIENMLFCLIKQTWGKTPRAWFLQLSSISFWLYPMKPLPKIGSLFCCESNSIALLVLKFDQFLKSQSWKQRIKEKQQLTQNKDWNIHASPAALLTQLLHHETGLTLRSPFTMR